MQTNPITPDEYVASLPDERKEAVQHIRLVLQKNLPKGFEETMGYGMIAYVVPHDIYPKGYHCDNKLPLPFINLASQKNHIALYHVGLYADKKLLGWFKAEYSKYIDSKLDMGKSCIRFKKMNQIPYDLIGQLARKMTVEEWVARYENNFNK